MFLGLALLVPVLQAGTPNRRLARADSPGPITSSAVATFTDSVVSRAIAESHTSGAVVVVVADGHVLFARGYGLANRESRAVVDPATTLWRLASTSKSLTALAVLRLAQAGRLRLDDDVNTHLRSFKVPDAFGRPITIRELLLHTSGLDDRLIGDGFLAGSPPPLSQVMAARLPRRIKPPGAYLYSNYDYGVLGAVVEQVSGVPFATFMRDSVLGPMGLRRTTFEQPLSSDWESDLAFPYAFSGGAFHRWPVVYHQSSPGGGATATADDMARYMEMMLDENAMAAAGFGPPAGIRQALGLDGLTGTERLSAGYGWRSRVWNARQVVETGGDLPGYTNVLLLVPEHHLGMWIADNSGKNAVTYGYLWEFLARFLPASLPEVSHGHLPVGWDSLSAFEGTFRPARFPHYELSKLGIIPAETRVQQGPDGTLRFWGERWIRVGPLQFQRESGPMVMTFARDSSRGIVGLDNMERIGWYETRQAQMGFVLLFLGTFLILILAWAVARRRERRAPRVGAGAPARTLRLYAASASLLNVMFLGGVIAYFALTPSYDLMLGLSATLRVILALPLIAIALTLLSLPVFGRAVRREAVSTGAAVMHTVFLCSAAGFCLFLNHWNLLGYRG